MPLIFIFINKLKIIKDIKKLRKTEFLNQLKVNDGRNFFKLKLIKIQIFKLYILFIVKKKSYIFLLEVQGFNHNEF